MSEQDRVCELCCGAGGMGLGFSRHFQITDAYDILPAAVQTYGSNHPETAARRQDIRNLTGARGDWEGITGIIGGPPCQAWSRRNIRQDPADPRALLLDEYLRIVEEVSPRFFVLENVTTVPRAAKEAITRKAKALGYTVRSSCLNAADYGAAQTRRRWIAIGTRGRTIREIRKVQPRTVREAFAGIPENWGLMQSTPATLERLAAATPDEWQPMTGKYGNIIKLQWDAPAPTVVNVKKVYMVHPGEVRNISLAEAAALQGFPPGYAWHGTDTQIAQMIANAMPAEMASAIAEAIA
ncbi:MAG: DNA cytosine methyltransferase [Bacilli bacterium]